MIRLAALICMLALPAGAQDFRGLLPGMPASALGPIGEPMHLDRDDSGSTFATYPLPFEQRLDVSYDAAGTIVWLNTAAFPGAPIPPRGDGLRIGRMTFADVERRLGLESLALETPGLVSPHQSGIAFRMIFDHVDDPDMLVMLTFLRRDYAELDLSTPIEPTYPMDARFSAVTLAHRSHYDLDRDEITFVAGPRTAPLPFPLPLDEAFPPLIP